MGSLGSSWERYEATAHRRPVIQSLGVEFGGEKRIELVESLAATFEAVEWSAQPRLVCLEAAPGWGKTRILQELYARMARDQSYWPPALLTERGARSAQIHPGDFVAGNAVMPWLWWGVSCSRCDGSRAGPRR